MTTWQAGMRITDERLADGLTPVTTTTGLVAATDFSVIDFRGAKIGSRSFVLDMYVQRTGAQIAVVNSNIPDTLCCTVPVGWRPNYGTINGDFDDGVANGGFVIGTDGKCTLRTATASIDSGRNLRLHIGFTNT
jgi:hypothetical protein